MAELASKIKTGADASMQLSKLEKNAEDTATLFFSLNPYWNEATWKEMLNNQYQLEEQLIRQINEGSFSMTIPTYDAIYQNALKMTAYMITRNSGTISSLCLSDRNHSYHIDLRSFRLPRASGEAIVHPWGKLALLL